MIKPRAARDDSKKFRSKVAHSFSGIVHWSYLVTETVDFLFGIW